VIIESITFFISGALFGLVAGISPGPLLTLVISETLKHDRKEGIKVACVPLLTDVPIVFVSLFFLAKISASHFILGMISLTGAVFLAYLSYENFNVKGIDIDFPTIKSQSLKKGFITNILNPHPYLFWITVGAPTVLKASNVNVLSACMFISGFYLLLIGSKIGIVLFIGKSKTFLKSTLYIYILRFLGLILFFFAIIFMKEALKFFGLL
jgi:threonine/homoserine/homoserine lactone efflux protein